MDSFLDYFAISPPGAPGGPCAGPCSHAECHESRRVARLHCVDCGQPIGYDERFYVESLDWSRPTHTGCAIRRFRARSA